ncbi:MAG: DUF2461 domain-containing protein [Bacteroidales bacterium]|nr:DUF2461 domain-containing protein [Bacteroidales bacterium]
MKILDPIVFEFLQQLRENNNREWYHANKRKYQFAKASVEAFLDQLIPALMKLNPAFQGLTPKMTMFRIFRDLRFSKDKRPYKTNFGAVIARGGRKSKYSGLYIHLEPGNSMVGGGIYHPEKEVLDAIRKEIYYNGHILREIIGKPEFKKYYGTVSSMGDELKHLPKGYSNEAPNQDLLKMKTMVAMHQLDDDVLLSDQAIPEILKAYKILHPLNDFLNEAIDMEEMSGE